MAWDGSAQAMSLRKQMCMYLEALSIGCGVPRGDFDAIIHSVFHSAINLSLSSRRVLLTLVASSEADLPQGIRLDTPRGFSFEGFQTGRPAICRNGTLHFENPSLSVQLRGARRWNCDLPALKGYMADPAMAAAWGCVWNALNRRQRRTGSEIVAEDLCCLERSAGAGMPRRAGEAMCDLVNATRRYALTDTSAINSLIGLGSGLTPSGDDLLVGYLAGLFCTVRDKSERMQFVSKLGRTINRLSRQTNDVSRTYLHHAAGGQVSSRLAGVAEAICSGEKPDRLLEVAETAMQVGHTSGMDAVTGLLIGLAAWDTPYFESKMP